MNIGAALPRCEQGVRDSLNRHLGAPRRICTGRVEPLEPRIVLATNIVPPVILDGTIWAAGDVQRIVADTQLPDGSSLTIEPGTIVQFDAGFGFELLFAGTVTQSAGATKILFTSVNDDTGRDGLAGTADDLDTNSNGASVGARGDWESIRFADTSVVGSLSNWDVRFGGSGGVVGSMILEKGISLTGSIVRDSATAGVRIDDVNPTLSGITLTGNLGAAISMTLESAPVIASATITNNGLNGALLDAGALPGNTSWNNPAVVYQLANTVTVPQGMTLSIGAGQVVKLNSQIVVNGTLAATGTAAQPIILTSMQDDSAGGDTNNDGAATSPGLGNWIGITFATTSTDNVLEHTELRYAGNSGLAALKLDHAPLTMRDSVVRDSAVDGLRAEGSDPVLTDNIFRDNGSAAISMDLTSNPAITGGTYFGNGINGLAVDGGTLMADAEWNDPDIVYLITDDLTVGSAVKLTIAPRQVVKFVDGRSLLVDGTLDARGTVATPIIFTSDSDGSVGGNTRLDVFNPLTPSNGEWGAIKLNSTSTGSVIDRVEIRYGGGTGVVASGMVWVAGGELTLSNSTLRHSTRPNLRVEQSGPTISGNVLRDATEAAISLDLAAHPTFTGNQFFGNLSDHARLDGGTLPAGTTTWGNTEVIYELRDRITVPAGATLSIVPGKIIKASTSFTFPEQNSITVNGTLNAVGTGDEPIIFTGMFDDSAGGRTVAASTGIVLGGWEGMIFNDTSTGNVFDHVEVRYAGYGLGEAILADGADVVFRNGVVLKASGFAFKATDAADVTVTNSVLAPNSGGGLRGESSATLTAINNTIHGEGTGVGVEVIDATATLTNNIITNHQSNVKVAGTGMVTPSFNDVFGASGGGANWEGIADPTGTNGNVSKDPLFFNAASLQFQLRAQSPLIDAGTSDGAPATDRIGSPRFDTLSVPNTGGGASPFVDLGAYERLALNASDIDLTTTSVTPAVTNGLPGDSVSVSWTVKNIGAGPAAGPWTDAIYLSPDPVWTPDDILLGTQPREAFLGSGFSYSASKSGLILPAVVPGDYYFIVRANSGNDVFEGQTLANNPGASTATIEMDLPPLALGVAAQAIFDTTGQAKFYKVTVPEGEDLSVVLDGITGATNELYVRFGDLPSRQLFDQRGVRMGADQSVSIADSPGGDYFVMVYGADVPAQQQFSVLASLAGFSITNVTPMRGSNTGEVTITLSGAQFDGNSHPRLIDSLGATIEPLRVYFTDSGLLAATFDLQGHPTGLADVQVVNTGPTVTTLTDGFDVITGSPGRLVTDLITPGRIRTGRDFNVFIELTNAGDTDILAPVMRLTNIGPDTLSVYRDRHDAESAVDLVGIGPNYPAGILPPDASVRLPLFSRSADARRPTADEFNLFVAEYNDSAIDWDAITPFIQPDGFDAAEWGMIMANIETNIGGTWNDFARAISNDASLLPSRLGSNALLGDVFQLEIDKAFADLNLSLSGHVFLRDDAHPVGNVEMFLYNPATQVSVTAVSLNDGSFLVPKIAAGTYDVTFTGFVFEGPAQQITIGAVDVNGLELTVTPGGILSGSVVLNPRGVPLRDVAIAATLPDGSSFVTATDSMGRYTLDSLPGGTYEIRADAPGLGSSIVRGVALTAGDAVPQINLAIGGSQVSGQLTGPGGPLAGVLVSALGVDGTMLTATTDANGSYTFPGVSPQDYSITADVAGLFEPLLSVTVPKGANVTGANLAATAAGSLAGTLTSAVDDSAAAFVAVEVTIGTELFSTLTDATGDYLFNDLPTGAFSLEATSDDFMIGTASGSIVANSQALANVELAPAGVVSGLVTNSLGGAPLAHVTIFAADSTGLVAQTVTDATGAYTLDGLRAGTYQILLGDVSTPGTVRQSVTLDPQNTTATADLSIAVSGFISGTIFDSDGTTPLAGASTILFENNEPLLTAAADSQGHYSFVIVADGTYAVSAAAGDRLFSIQDGLAVSGGASLTNVNVTAGAEVISGLVTDSASGDPIGGAIVSFVHQPPGGPLTSAFGLTAADGSYSFTHATSGAYRVVVNAFEHATFTQSTTVTTGVPATVNAVLGPGTALSGTVQSAADGTPLEAAEIRLISASEPLLNFSAGTDATGAYTFPGLPEGDYTVIVSAEGKAVELHNVHVGTTGEMLNVSLDAPAAPVSGTATGAGGALLANVVVTARDADGNVLAQTVTDSNGAFSFDTLPAGTFAITASAEGYRDSAAANVMLAGTPVTGVTLAMTAAGFSDPEAAPAADPRPGVMRLEKLFAFRKAQENSDPQVEALKAFLAAHANSDCVGALEAARRTVEHAEHAYAELFYNGQIAFAEDTPLFPGVGGIARTREMATLTESARSLANWAEELGALKSIDIGSPTTIEHYDIATILKDVGSVYSEIGAGNFEDALIELDRLGGILQRLGRVTGLLFNGYTSSGGSAMTAVGVPPPDIAPFNSVNFGFDGVAPTSFGKDTAVFYRETVSAISGILAPLLTLRGTIAQLLRFEAAQKEFEYDLARAQEFAARLVECENKHEDPVPPKIKKRPGRPRDDIPPPPPPPPPPDTPPPPVIPFDPGPKIPTHSPVSAHVLKRILVISNSKDPNHKIGPDGFGDEGFIQPGMLQYEVQFENDPNPPVGATAAAQIVTITDTLDPDLDLSTFEFSKFGFGPFEFDVPTAGLAHYQTILDLRPDGIELLVPVTLDLNPMTRVLTATFESLHPDTMLPPDGVDEGFLPLNNAAHDGEGFIIYNVSAMPGLASGTEITNEASIVFDTNDPLVTPATLHTIDATPPESAITTPSNTPLTPLAKAAIELTFGGTDAHSGLASIDVFVSDNGGAFQPAFLNVTGTTATFVGKPGHEYRFYTVGRDQVGNVEAAPALPDTTITLAPTEQIVLSKQNPKLAFTDENGTAVKATWSGLGTATIERFKLPVTGQGDIFSIAIAGSDGKSRLTITPTKGDTTVATVDATTPLAALSMKGVHILDHVDLDGAVPSITLGNLVSGADLTLDGVVAKGAKVTAGDVNGDSDLKSAGPLASLTAVRWLDGAMSAPWLGTMKMTGAKKPAVIAGDFGADLTLTDAMPKQTLKSAKIAGTIFAATWTIAGHAGPISAFATAANWTADFTGNVASIKTTGDASGQITAKSIKTFTVGADLTGAQVTLTQAVDPKLKALSTLKITGFLDNTTIGSAGHLGSLTAGAFRDSEIFAGVKAGTTGLPTALADFDAVAQIASVTVKGIKNLANAFVNSNIAAQVLGKITLRDVLPGNGNTDFGLAADRIAALTIYQGKAIQDKLAKLDTVVGEAARHDDFVARVI